ncbi:hypothetical protein EXW72_24855 [Pseudomonas sp. BCA14]|uniref:hypothetical protein n=1 Tax=unclassified Pseudomonas TaxID=196821 RepID=UPI00106EC082|nr:MULTISPECIES: hypothetical protein [unclassified Pseudomonas]TFF06888.1 hypothetical protein EXW71_21770 [Pseudomonas sp. BCA17]TFF09326.1 hypothetical protein EXW70_09785 [Pseudomonas sp. JMN1]TFF19440.1 hypothetical protein EXW72_24855 [Pseudomonas sp. BCA14]TFF24180.1 hypothetical protein EXW73_16995 [Pseudomonas sp. BCA13]
MPLPTNFFGVTAKQLLVLVSLGCAAAYLLNDHEEHSPETLALEAFIRSQEQVSARVGAVLEMALVRQVVAYPTNTAEGYKRSMFVVEGEKGQLMVTLKQIDGERGIEVTEIRDR